MDERERFDRTEALDNAVGHQLGDETADDIIKNAEKYFKFLQGTQEKQE